MADIFISYASPDLERAQALAAALERKGWSVWWHGPVLTGEIFADLIQEELAAARCVTSPNITPDPSSSKSSVARRN